MQTEAGDTKTLKVKHFVQSPAYCGPASLKIAMSYFGKDVSEEELAKLAHATKENGTEPEGLMKAAKENNFNVLVREGKYNAEELKKEISEIDDFVNIKKLPVIIGWFDKDGGHYAVVTGTDSKNLILSDPASDEPVRYLEKAALPETWFIFLGEDNSRVSWGWYMVLDKVNE
jgi:ABC-type bacteriocin/lantibiotic exporter with double-glycine peptidase domain